MARDRHGRLAEVRAQKAAILAVTAPLREERDRIVSEARAKELDLNRRIRAAEEGLFALRNEEARLARELGARGVQAAGLGQTPK